MKVKVGDVVYSADDGPIMVILTEQDKMNISNMLPDYYRYCEYLDDTLTGEEINEWMGLEENERSQEMP